MDSAGIVPAPMLSGCCGLAGSFGAEAGHEAISRSVAELELLPALRATGEDDAILADGFSCRTQIAFLDGRRAQPSGRGPGRAAGSVMDALRNLAGPVLVLAAAVLGSVVGYTWLRRVTGVEPEARLFRATDPPRRWLDPSLRAVALIAAIVALLALALLVSKAV